MTQWGVDTLFNPAKRHMDEEKRRLQSTRQEVGDNSGGKRIDLESGKVRISRKSAEGSDPSAEADDTEADDTDRADSEATDAETGDVDDAGDADAEDADAGTP